MITPRPIRFRAWTGTEMVPVESLHRNDGCLIWYGAGGHMGIADAWDHPMWREGNPKPTLAEMKPVMQFTGLVDSKGVDIYEGDIVSVPTELPVSGTITVETRMSGPIYHSEVKWGSDGYIIEPFGWTYDDIKDFRSKWGQDRSASLTGRCYLAGHRENALVIVGNVFSNPDLLKS